MPTSDPVNLGQVALEIAHLSPKTILDVGIGFGKYGFISREVLDASRGNYWKFKTHITGVEIFEKYILPHHKTLYNKIIIGDIRKIPVKEYDLVIFGDVIEHLEKEEGKRLLNAYKNSNILVSCPNGKHEQGAVYGNENETHLSEWTRKDFDGWNILYEGAILTALYKK